MTATPARGYRAIAIAIVVAAVLISASLYVGVGAPTRTTTTTRAVTTSGTFPQTTCSEIAVNGTGYCSLDVTDRVTFSQESGDGVLNAPVTFMGVTFESTCPDQAFYCVPESQFAAPGAVSGGAISLELVFPDGAMQDISAPFLSTPCPCQVEYYLTSSQTSAGFLLKGESTAPYLMVILLVEPWQQPTPTAIDNSANSLQLQLSLNSSSPASGFEVSVNVDDYNTLASANNVTAANDWLAPLSYLDGAPCGDDTPGPVVGFAVAQGHYTSSNVTTAEFLDLVNPKATYNCPLYLGYASPAGFLFVPMSEAADSYGCNQQMCMSGGASTGLTASGYWNQGGAFTSFPRGTYTVLGEDEWGDSALAYFTVS